MTLWWWVYGWLYGVMVGLQKKKRIKKRKGMLFTIIYYYYYYYNLALGRLYVMERPVLLGTHPNFSIHFLLILGPMSQNPHYNTTNMFAWVGAEQSEVVFFKRFSVFCPNHSRAWLLNASWRANCSTCPQHTTDKIFYFREIHRYFAQTKMNLVKYEGVLWTKWRLRWQK